MKLLRAATRIGLAVFAILAVSGCCVLPFGDGHVGRGRYHHDGYRP